MVKLKLYCVDLSSFMADMAESLRIGLSEPLWEDHTGRAWAASIKSKVYVWTTSGRAKRLSKLYTIDPANRLRCVW